MYHVLPVFWTCFQSFVWEIINLSFFTWIGCFAVLTAFFLGALKLIPKPRSK